ncbi:amino acid adenylation domain-containing protein [Kitasatospora sp. NPDC018058]|uniref:amino acid adenylation domain-containing protein n=1 Tax=Kitasatospora sp. NPDC018058 TaxID=3364025 RepID=UPI0037C18F97
MTPTATAVAPAAERPRAFGGPGGQADTETIMGVLRDLALSTPDAPALVDPDGTLSYAELWLLVDEFAATMRNYRISRGDRVGVVVDRSRQTVICLLALARAGAAYVPLDGAQPADRLARMVRASGVRTVLGHSRSFESFPAGLAEYIHIDLALLGPAPLGCPTPPRPDDLVYVIHTSGSTGDPKGVMVPHRALVTAARSLIGLCRVGPGDRVLSFASLSWDTSGEEIYSALLSGATLVIDPAATSGSVPALLSAVKRHGITVIDLPTGFWNEVVAFLDDCLDDEDGGGPPAGDPLPESLRLVIIGGEEVRPAQVRRWSELVPDRIRLLNTYGQTETVLVTHAAEIGGAAGRALRADDRVPIGRPLPHVRQLLLPVADGGPYELLVGGPTLALGYAAKPETTAERFVLGADGPERYYRTGDLVERDPDGRLAFLGRTDRQVKVRGHRVEPEEVERALHGHPEVREAAVVPVTGPDGGVRLLAAVVPHPPSAEGGADAARILDWLAGRLPAYLRPSRITVLPFLPLLPNGKVDRQMIATGTPSAPARPSVETITAALAELCSAILNTDCGADDDFFDAGGDSLLATRLISKVYRRFDTELTYLDVFEHRTPAELAQLIHRKTS